jgi:hypothetical protein
LFPAAKVGPTTARNSKPAGDRKTFNTAEAALAELERRHGKPSALWTYHDADGKPVGLVVRWDTSTGKEIRPISRHPDGWRIAAMLPPRPLYNLSEVLKADPREPVLVVEGEKCAAVAKSLGFVVTTSSGGSGAAEKTDWQPLAGREAWILPDNDPPGRKYAETVAGILAKLTPAPVIRVIELPGLPSGGDVVEWIEGHGDAAEPDTMRAEIEALAKASEPWRPDSAEEAGPDAPRAAPSTDSRNRMEPDIVCLADVEAQQVPWLWYGRIPLGRVTLLVGRPGGGKSFVTCDLAARISTGAPWPEPGGLSRAPLGDTLFLCAEDDPADTIRPRLDASGADCRRTHLLKAAKILSENGSERSVAFDLSNVELIRDALTRLPDCKLVVIDPIGSFLGGQVDAHRDNEVRSVLMPLAALASERKVAVLLVCHTRKAEALFADDMALGSRAFVGLARSVWHLIADPHDETEQRKLFLAGKCNLSARMPGLAFRIEGDPGRLTWEPDLLDLRADDVVAFKKRAQTRGRKPEEMEAAAKWLIEFLKDGPRPVTEIRQEAQAAELHWATVRRAQDTLGIVPKKKTFHGGWEWGLPDGYADGQNLIEDAHSEF